MKDKEDAWDSKRDAVFQNFISSRSYSVSKSLFVALLASKISAANVI
jgi:hypothetical protein